MVSRWTPVILSVLRMEFPSTKAARTRIFFSVGSTFMILINVLPLAVLCQGVNALIHEIFSLDVACQWHYIGCMEKPQPKRKHDRPLQIRATNELVDLFHKAADAAGLNFSAWARARLIQAARRELKVALKN